MSSRRFLTASLAVASLLVAGNASAAQHDMRIVEVMAGPGSYVNLEMFNPGQVVLGGHSIVVYDKDDNVLDTVALAPVSKADKGSRILIGTTQTEATFGVKPDFGTMKTLPPAGGRVCFDPAPGFDCFSWGNYPNKAPAGPPFGVLSITSAAKRKIAGGATTGLDFGEDSDNSALDFASGTPTPRNNAGATVPAPDAGGSTTSSSSSSSSSSTGGEPSSSSSTTSASSATGGVTTNPSSSSTTTTSSGAAPAAAPPAEDEGCNTTGETTGLTAVPLLALVALAVAKRRRRA